MQTECNADLCGFARVEGAGGGGGVRRWHIRLKLSKISALVRTRVRRIKLTMPTAFPYQAEYHAALTAAATV